MDVAFFSAKKYDREFFGAANAGFGHNITYFETRLSPDTAPLAAGRGAACAFVNDDLGAEALRALAAAGVGLVALRCSGFNNVDLRAAAELGMAIARVPAYSPHAVAEHTVGLMLALNRKLVKAHARVREGNFSLEGLAGFDMRGKTAGIVGTGKIGAVVAGILGGFGMEVLACDLYENDEVKKTGVRYVPLGELLAASDIVTLHCPLTPETFHMIDDKAISRMKDGVMLINTSRGKLVDTRPVIKALKSGKIGYLGIDVYEEEADLFFEDLSDKIIQDDVFARLLTFPNVLITGHQAFFTDTAMSAIAEVTLRNISDFEAGEELVNRVTADAMKK